MNQGQISLSFPDGSKRSFASGITGIEIAQSIASSLAKQAVVISINDKLCDLTLPITEDATIKIITRKDQEALEIIRHDTAHILAQAVQELFPGTQVTIGPSIENGFYYDFARSEPFTPEDLSAIESKMKEIIDRDSPFIREVWPRDEAIKFFKSKGENFKAELIQDLPESEVISIYKQGEWLDLCRGPHMMSTGQIGKAFKLMSVAGSYWRGDHRNASLQRIYGTAWRDQKELEAYLHMLEEAAKRDHRKLGKELSLFHLQEEATGSVFWHPKGWAIWRILEQYMRRKLDASGYQEVKTPQMIDKVLWEKSGHWEKFRENMFIVKDDADDRIFALKPMNCPAHVQIFRQGVKSYRDLPIRMAEFGSCMRNESSGSMHGIMRVRSFTQDDAHIFCREDQIMNETRLFIKLLNEVYRDLGFEKFEIKLSDRPEVRAGEDSTWDKAENALKHAIESLNLPYEMNPGEGAFYGPKLEFHLKDTLGRSWQCGTLQLDFVMPERLDAQYTNEEGNKERPVMLHRAILGSLERFIGILIEHYAGKFPVWLAPVQIVVASITSDVDEYTSLVYQSLKEAGVRAQIDIRNEKINYKIREHSVHKVPYIAVIGQQESMNKTVTLRVLGQEAQEQHSLEGLIAMMTQKAMSPMGDLNGMDIPS